MIVHSVQFDRPLLKVSLVGDAEGLGAETEVVEGPSGRENGLAPPVLSSAAADPEVLQRLIDGISTGMQNVQVPTDVLTQDFKELSVRMAMMIVRKIAGDSNAICSERLAKLLEDGLSRPEPAVAIWVHPDFESRVRELLPNNTGGESPQIKADDTVERGECRIEFGSHELISNLESQFAEIESRLLEVVADDHV